MSKPTDLNERADKLLAMRPTHEPNRKLLAHLQTEREHLFTFLAEPGVQATNWRAEQALRPAMPEPAPLPETRYRIVCYELEGDQETVILDATAQAFIAVTGTIDEHNTVTGQGTHAGPLPLLGRLASIITDDERLAS